MTQSHIERKAASQTQQVGPQGQAAERQRVLDAAESVTSSDAVPRDEAAERKGLVLLIGVVLLALLLDQFSKAWIRGNLAPGDAIPMWSGVVHLSHVWNYGAAWGMLSGQRLVLVGISILVLLGAASMARDFVRRGRLATVGLGLIVGGAIGNLTDRVLQGYVTDMIDMDTGWQWLRNFPVFNVADSSLTVGVCLLLIHFVFDQSETANASQNERVA
jgi:signal peptidase II